jgi:hypothetical protein
MPFNEVDQKILERMGGSAAGPQAVTGADIPGVPAGTPMTQDLVPQPPKDAPVGRAAEVTAKRIEDRSAPDPAEMPGIDVKILERAVSKAPAVGQAAQRAAAEMQIFVDPMSGALSSSDPEMQQAFNDANSALATGIRRGIMRVPLGALEAVGEQAAPGMTKDLAHKYNAWESRFDEVAAKHPGLSTAGEVMGTVVGVLGSARALGAVTPTLITKMIPEVLKGALATGVIAGGTAYLPEPGGRVVGGEKGAQLDLFGVEIPERLAGGVIGGTLGVLGTSVFKAVSWGVKTLADSHAYHAFTNLLTEVTRDVTVNSDVALNSVLSHVKQTWQLNREKYTIRNTAGREISGFDTAGMGAAVDRGVEATTVSQRGAVRAVVRKAEDELGITDAKVAQDAYAAELKTYNAAAQDLTVRQSKFLDETVVGGVQGGGRQMPPSVQQRMLEDAGLTADARLSPAPTAPVIPTVTGEQFNKAIDALNDARFRGGATNATRTQIDLVKRELWKEAERFAKDVDPGLNARKFLDKSKEAAEFYKANILPIKNVFGESSLEKLTQGKGELTPVDMYGAIVNAIEGGKFGPDKVALERFKQAGGPRIVEPMQRITSKRMLEAGAKEDGSFDPAALRDYFMNNRESLSVLLPRKTLAELDGMSKVMERVAKEGKRLEGLRSAGSGSMKTGMGFFGIWQIAEAISNSFLGGPVGPHLAKGAIWFAGYPTAAAAYKWTANQLHNPQIRRLMERAATLKPDSAEMDQLLRTIARVSQKSTDVAARLAAPVGGEAAPAEQTPWRAPAGVEAPVR